MPESELSSAASIPAAVSDVLLNVSGFEATAASTHLDVGQFAPCHDLIQVRLLDTEPLHHLAWCQQATVFSRFCSAASGCHSSHLSGPRRFVSITRTLRTSVNLAAKSTARRTFSDAHHSEHYGCARTTHGVRTDNTRRTIPQKISKQPFREFATSPLNIARQQKVSTTHSGQRFAVENERGDRSTVNMADDECARTTLKIPGPGRDVRIRIPPRSL